MITDIRMTSFKMPSYPRPIAWWIPGVAQKEARATNRSDVAGLDGQNDDHDDHDDHGDADNEEVEGEDFVAEGHQEER